MIITTGNYEEARWNKSVLSFCEAKDINESCFLVVIHDKDELSTDGVTVAVDRAELIRVLKMIEAGEG